VTVLNRNLAERCPLGKFITFFYAVLNTRTGELQYTNAGHNPPILIRADGRVEHLPGSDLIMGLFPSVSYKLSQVSLEPGDLLALFSDGVTEARNRKDEELGETGLAQFLQLRRSHRCSEIITELAQYVRQWCGSPSFTDDFTVLLVKRASD
jgi:sigma-B regulation protein RsbU (phosphoserine phosphatase)